MNNLEQMKKRRNKISTIITILIVLNLLLLLAFASNVGDANLTTNNNTDEVSVSEVPEEQEDMTSQYEGNINIADVATGANFTIALDSNGYVWSWGQNNKGQLGNGTLANSADRQAVLSEETNSNGRHIQLSNVKQIAVGEYHAVALTNSGEVYVWGYNYFGQAGNSSKSNVLYAQKVEALEGITIRKISSGANCTVVLTESGEVHGFGDSSDGQLGYYNELGFTSIREIEEAKDASKIKLSNIKEICAGYNHVIAINNENKVLTWGDNIGSRFAFTNIKEVPFAGETVREIKAGNGVSIALTESGNVYTWNLDNTTPTIVTLPNKENSTEKIKVRMDNNKSNIAIVNKTYYIIDTDNNVYSWGVNTVGQTGINKKTTSDIKTPTKMVIDNSVTEKQIDKVANSVVPGVSYSGVIAKNGQYDTGYAINADGYILGWGYAGTTLQRTNTGKLLGDATRYKANYLGGVRLSNIKENTIELKVEESRNLMDILKESNSITDKRVNLYRASNSKEKGLKFRVIDESVAKYNDDTKLLTGVRMGRTSVEVSGASNTISINVKVIDENMVAYPKIESRDNYTLALRADGTVWAWGYNSYLGITDSSQKNNRVGFPMQLQGIKDVVDIGAGENFAILLMQDGTVWSWGYNASGQLGNNTKTSTARNSIATSKVSLQKVQGIDTEIVSISAGKSFSMALDVNGNIWTWGAGGSYQLGTGKNTNSLTAKKVSISGEKIKQIQAGGTTAYTLTESGYIYAWGNNSSHKCGNLTGGYVKTPTKVTNISNIKKISAKDTYLISLKSDGTLWGIGANYSTGKTIPGISNVEDVVATNYQSGAIFKYTDGKVAYGTYLYKASPTITRLSAIGETQYFTDTMLIGGADGFYVVAKNDGTVWTVGKNNYAQLGNKSTNTKTTTTLSCISFDNIVLDKHEITLKEGATEELHAKYHPGFNLLYMEEQDIDLKYKSLNEEIAIQDGNVITGIKSGKTYVEGIYEQKNIIDRVTVNVLSEDEVTTPKVSAGYRHTLALKSDGTVWGWGYDYRGALGGRNRTISEPEKLPLNKKYIDIAAGHDYSLFVDTDGYVWAMGYNGSGSLGNNSTIHTTTPVKVQKQTNGGIEDLTDIVKVQAIARTSIALDKNGNVYVWGSGTKKYATLLYTHGLKAQEISGNLILTEDGCVLVYKGSKNLERIPVEHIVQISHSKHTTGLTNGNGYCMALDGKGNVYTWVGYNTSSDKIRGTETKTPEKLNINTDENTKIVDIQAGGDFALARDNKGQVYSWSKPKYSYTLGRGESISSTDAITPIMVEELYGINIESIAGTSYISGEYARGYAITNGGSVYGFGYNGKYSFLGRADTSTKYYYIPTLIGESRAKFIVDGEEVTRLYLDTNESKDIEAIVSDTFNLRKDYNKTSGNNGFDWTVLDEDLVSLSGEQGNTRLVTAKDRMGETVITATSKNTGAIARLYIEVKQKDSKVTPKIESAKAHTLALKSDGTVWGWGDNSYGQLGVSPEENTSEPQQTVIENGDIITDIATSISHTLMLTTNGEVYSCGYNNYNQLGYGTSGNYQYIPKKIDGLSDIVKIATGERYSLALDKYGRLWFFGYSATKVNNINYSLNKTTPTRVTSVAGVNMRKDILNTVDITNEYLLTKDGEVISINLSLDVTNSNGNVVSGTKVNFSNNENVKIKKITKTSGEKCSGHVAFLAEDGSVYTTGLGLSGQLGNNTNTTVSRKQMPAKVVDSTGAELRDIVDIYTGYTHTVAVNKNGIVYAWGSNIYGELRSVAADAGTNVYYAAEVIKDARIGKGILVSAGNKYSMVVDETGYVYACGLGLNGQLGNGLNMSSTDAVRVGIEGIKLDTNHLTLKENGSSTEISVYDKQLNLLYNPTIDLKNAKSNNDNVVTVNISEDKSNVLEINPVNAGTTSILLKGQNTNNQSIDECSSIIEVTVLPEKAEMAEDIQLPANKIIAPMTASGYSHTIILKSDGTVWCYGDNTYGQIGVDSSVQYSDSATQVRFPDGAASIICVDAGDNFSVAVDANGNVYTWGYNLTSMSENYSPELVSGLSNIIKVVAGKEHCLALNKDGYVYAWGVNSTGLLGTGSTTTITEPIRVNNIAKVIDIATGTDHSIVLTSSGQVYTTGNNNNGQLGVSDISNRLKFDKVNIDATITYIEAGNGTSVAIDTDSNLWVWGNNKFGQLGLGENTDKITIPTKCTVADGLKVQSTSAGLNHIQVVTQTGELYTSGSNKYGELGIGSDIPNTNRFVKVEKLGNNVMRANAGATYSTAIAKDGTVYGFGDYNHGNTNRVSLTNSNIPVEILNDALYLGGQEITLNINKTFSINANGRYKLNVLYKKIDEFRYESANENIASVDEMGVITGVSVGTTRVNAIDDSGRISSILVKVLPDGLLQSPTVEGANEFAVVTDKDGKLYLFGDNENIINSSVPEKVSDNLSLKSVKAGDDFIVAINYDGGVWTLGDNTYGQLGITDTQGTREIKKINSNYIKSVTQIDAGNKHIIALDNMGKIYVWGDNSNGQLGLNESTSKINIPTIIKPIQNRAISVSAGGNYSSIVDLEGHVYILGNRKVNQVPDIGNAIKVATGKEETMVLTEDGKVYLVNNQTAVAVLKVSDKNVVDIAVNSDTFICLAADKTLYTFGNNENGQIGIGSDEIKFDSATLVATDVFTIGAGNANTYYINTNGELFSAGLNTSGQLGNGTNGIANSPTSIASSKYTKVGDRRFKINRIKADGQEKEINSVKVGVDWTILTGKEDVKTLLQEEKTIITLLKEGKEFNTFGNVIGNTSDYTFNLSDTNVASLDVGDRAKIKANTLGETILLVTNTVTNEQRELKIIVSDEELRIEEIYIIDSKNRVYDGEPTSIDTYKINIEGSTNNGVLNLLLGYENDTLTAVDENGNSLTVKKVDANQWAIEDLDMEKPLQVVTLTITSEEGEIYTYTVTISKEVIVKVDSETVMPDEENNYTKFINPDNKIANVEVNILDSENTIIIKDTEGKEIARSENGNATLTTQVNVANNKNEFIIEIVNPEGNILRDSKLMLLKSSLESIEVEDITNILGKVTATKQDTTTGEYIDEFYVEIDEENNPSNVTMNIINEKVQSVKINGVEKSISGAGAFTFDTNENDIDIEFIVLDEQTGNTYKEKYKLTIHKISADIGIESIVLNTVNEDVYAQAFEKSLDKKNTYEIILHNSSYDLSTALFNFTVKPNSQYAQLSIDGKDWHTGTYTFEDISPEYSENKAIFTLYAKAENEIDNQTYKLIIYKQSETVKIQEITATSFLADGTNRVAVAEQVKQTNNFIKKVIKSVNGYDIKIKLDNVHATIQSITVNSTEDNIHNLANVLTLKTAENGVYTYSATDDVIGKTINIVVKSEYEGTIPVEYTLELSNLSDNANFETIQLGENILDLFEIDGKTEPVELDKIEAKLAAEDSDSLDVIAENEFANVEIYTIDVNGNIRTLASGIQRASVKSLDLNIGDTKTIYAKITSEDEQNVKIKELEIRRQANNTDIMYVTFNVNGKTMTVEVENIEGSEEEQVRIPETFINSNSAKLTVTPVDEKATVIYEEEGDTYKLIEDFSEENQISVIVVAEDGTEEEHLINIHVVSSNTNIMKQLVETDETIEEEEKDEFSAIEIKSDEEFEDKGNNLYCVTIKGYETIDLLITPENENTQVELAIVKEAEKVIENKQYIKTNRITLNATIITEVEVKAIAEDGVEKIYTIQVMPEESSIEAVTVQAKGNDIEDELVQLTSDDILNGVATVRVHPYSTSATIELTAKGVINTLNVIANEGMTSSDGAILEQIPTVAINNKIATINVDLLDKSVAEATVVNIEVTIGGKTETITINIEKRATEAVLETVTLTGTTTEDSVTTEPYNNPTVYSRNIVIDSEDNMFNITARTIGNGKYEIYKVSADVLDDDLNDIDLTRLEKIEIDSPVELNYEYTRFIIVISSEFGENTERYELYARKLNHDVSIKDLTITVNSQDGKLDYSVYEFGNFDSNGNIDILVPKVSSEVSVHDLILSNEYAIAKWAKSDEVYEDYKTNAKIVYSEELDGQKVYIKVITENGDEKVYCLNIKVEQSTDTSILTVEADEDIVNKTTVVGVTPEGEPIEMFVLTIRDTVDAEVIVTLNDKDATVTKVMPMSNSVISTEPIDNRFTLSGISASEHNLDEDTSTDTKMVDITITVTAENGNTNDYAIRLVRKHTETGLLDIRYTGDNEETVTINSMEDLYREVEAKTEGVTIVSATPICSNAKVYIINSENQRVEIGENGQYFDIPQEAQIEIKLVVVAEYGNEQEYTLTIKRKIADEKICEIEKVIGNAEEIQIDNEAIHYDYANKNIEDKDIYTQYINEDITSINIEAIAKHEHATVNMYTIDGKTELSTGVGKTTYNLEMPLDVLFERIKLQVISEDTTNTKEYEVWFIRKTNDISIEELYVDDELINASEDGNYYVEATSEMKTAKVRLIPSYKYAYVSVNLQPFEWQETTVNIENIDTAILDDNDRIVITLKVQIPAEQSLTGESLIGEKYLYIVKKYATITGKIISENYNKDYSGIEVNFTDKQTGEVKYTAITEVDGTYSAKVPSGVDYNMVVSKKGYLTYKVTDIPTVYNEQTYMGFTYLIAGEISGDDYIDLRDLVKINKKINFNSNNINNNDCDFNEDGIIDNKDLEILVNNYDKMATEIPYSKLLEEMEKEPEEVVTLPIIDSVFGVIKNNKIELTAKVKGLNLDSVAFYKENGELIGKETLIDKDSETITKEYAITTEFNKTHKLYVELTDKSGNATTKQFEVTDNIIRTVDDLVTFSSLVNSGKSYEGEVITLYRDLDLTGVSFTPIGKSISTKQFKGSFDGNEHTINNININSSSNYIGLFGYTNGATIKNLGITGTVTTTSGYTGGIIGYSKNTTVENCYNAANVTSANNAGGIVGYAEGNTIIKNCYNSGNITITKSNSVSGGIIGRLSTTDATVENCYNIGAISKVDNTNVVGEIVGYRISKYNTENQTVCVGNVINCHTSGQVLGIGQTQSITVNVSPTESAKLNDTTEKITDKIVLLTKLGDKFIEDTNKINNGYPILKWQKNIATKAISAKAVTPKALPAIAEETLEEQVKEITEITPEQLQATTSQTLTLPVSTKYRISSEYGKRIDPITKEETKMHYGIDIGADYKTPILAIADGVIVYAGDNGGYGYCIEIKHEINGDIIYSFYAHLYQIDVKLGDKVEKGQTIALEGGKPGDAGAGSSTGPHLHFEIRKEIGLYASAVDPRTYLQF